MIAYKFLRSGPIGPFSGVRWPDPAQDRSWVLASKLGPVSACRLEDLPEWPDDELWQVELAGDVRVEAGKLSAARGRLVECVSAWNAAIAGELALACARRARDCALAMPSPDDDAPARALGHCDSPAQIIDVADALTGLDAPRAAAVGRAVAGARAALDAQRRPPIAPSYAAEAAFIAAHAAAHAADDVAAALRERAWQAAWLAQRLALTPT